MRGREKKLLRAAVRASYEALAQLEPATSGGAPVSIATVARALQALLEGQIAILESLGTTAEAGGGAAGEPEEAAAPVAVSPAAAVAGPPAAAVAGPPATVAGPPAAGPAAAPATTPTPAVEPVVPREPLEPPPAAPAGPRPVAAAVARAALDAFPVPELNRWLASGTVFQIRGALAYLNMNSMGGRIDEMRGHIRKMGFADEVGRLDAEGVTGAVLLFRRAG